MKDDLRGAKIFLLMMAALVLCFVLLPWMQYIVMPMMVFPLQYIMMGLAWIFQLKGDADLGMAFFIFMICYYLEMLGIVSIIYWLIKYARSQRENDI